MSDPSFMNLSQLAFNLKKSLGIVQKRDLQVINQILGLQVNQSIPVGDDCAAIPDGDGYLLFAAEGMWPALLQKDPWFAGWCAVMVNLSDIAAMGGRAIAIVDTIWAENTTQALPILKGMQAAAQTYNVPIVGGHSNLHSAYSALGVSILGRAKNIISSFTAQPGDLLLIAIDLAGKMHPNFPFWNAATESPPNLLQEKLTILPYLSEHDLCNAGKDISMGGIIGTVLMLLETSKCGAILNLDNIVFPDGVSLETWLLCFPSYGFLLSVSPNHFDSVKDTFSKSNIFCNVIGEVTADSRLILQSNQKSYAFWDFEIDNFILDK